MLRRSLIAVTAVIALLALGAAATVVLRGAGGTRVTAYFTLAIGVYPGSDVRVLGVRVGRIESVRPEGGQVKAVFTVDRGVDVPADAKAVLIAPSVVSDRYIQLTPAYTGGAKLGAGAVIPAARTAAPVELDQLYESMKRLATELGPEGANRDGALSRVLEVGADNLQGNGRELRTMIQKFSKSARTLAGSQDDLFGTVDNLQKFTTMLAANDGQVRRAERQLASVSSFLAADRDELAAALSKLAAALAKVKQFVQDNRALLKANVDRLAKLTQTLADQRRALAEVLDVLPLDVQNVLKAYDPQTRSLRGRGNVLELLPLPAVGATEGTR